MRALPLLALPLLAAAEPPSRGDAWWRHVEVLAADDMAGRAIGSAGFDRAADYVIARFRALGLAPAGAGGGWKQPVGFVRQTITRAAVSLDGAALSVPDDVTVSSRGGPVPTRVAAGLVFAGYGLHVPEAGHDDFAGLDVRGKIVVVVSGGPAAVSGALKAHARSERAKLLAERGAAGVLTITTAGQTEVPWDRAKANAALPSLYLADAALRDYAQPLLLLAMNPASAEMLFAGSGTSFAAVAALADAAKPLPKVALRPTLTVETAATRAAVASYNIVARLPGSVPALAAEHVVLSAHLDHLGTGAAVNGDAIFNGAMDDASGVATLIEIAAKLRADRARPKRSIAFVIVTGEEQGLLGSRAFARAPSVPGTVVADLNFDMPLPLWPLKSVLVLGADESSLGASAATVSARQQLPLVPDPLPDRNAFVRSDQYSFIRAGIPSVAFKFGFARGTPEAEIERRWRAERYHQVGDDVAQPVMKADAVRLNDFVAAMALEVADAPARPAWKDTSFFRRFAK